MDLQGKGNQNAKGIEKSRPVQNLQSHTCTAQ